MADIRYRCVKFYVHTPTKHSSRPFSLLLPTLQTCVTSAIVYLIKTIQFAHTPPLAYERNGSIIRRANKIEQKYPLDGDTYIQLQSNRFKRLKPSDPLVRINLHGPRSPNLQFSSFVPAVREKYEGIRYAYSSRKLTLITDRVENRFRTEMN